MRLLYFSSVKDITELNSEEINIQEPCSVPQLLAALASKYPKLREIKFLFSINMQYCGVDGKYDDGSIAALKNSDEVALIPPVSGAIFLVYLILRKYWSISKPSSYQVEFKPENYELEITTDPGKTKFNGKINISISVHQKLNHISLDSNDLTIQKVQVNSHAPTYKVKAKKLVISQELYPGNHFIYIEWTGYMSEIASGTRGYFRSLSHNSWITATHFEPFWARTVFPCFDKPSLKATFDISIRHPQKYRALSNSELDHQIIQGEMVKSVFKKTVPITSYLVAWALETSYESIQDKSSAGIQFTILYPKETSSSANFCLKVGIAALDLMEQKLGVLLPLSKIDVFSAPDFPAEGMENMGLIIMDETALLRKDSDSTSKKQYSALLIAHELAHHWFGNLVTMEWWDDLWLNEGFAEYMQYYICSSIFPEWDLDSHFYELELQLALTADSSKYSHSLRLFNRDETVFFDDITYNKGAAVIRMMAEMVDEFVEGLFFRNLGLYLKEHLYSIVDTKSLLKSLQMDVKLDLEKIMSKWIDKPGYPLLSVNLSFKNCMMQLNVKQDRFSIRESFDDSEPWMFPLKVKVIYQDLSRSKYISDIIDLGIMSRSQEDYHKSIRCSQDLKPLIAFLNPGRTILTRIKYPKKYLKMINDILMNDISVLKPSERAGHVSDIFALFQNNAIEISDFEAWLDLNMKFLYLEDNAVVWKVVISNFPTMARFLNWKLAQQWIRPILEAKASNFDWTLPPGTSSLDNIRQEFLLFSIWAEDPLSIRKAEDYFTRQSDVHPSLLAAVYAGLVKSENQELIEIFVKDVTKHITLEKVLGLVSGNTKLASLAFEKFLDELRPQDIFRVMEELLKSRNGHTILWPYLVDAGTWTLGSKFAKVLEECVSQLENQDFILFAKGLDIDAVKRGLERNKNIL